MNLYKIWMVLIGLILNTYALKSQCVNNISSNPNDPFNNQIDQLYNGQYDNPFLNQFNWADTNNSGHPANIAIWLPAGFLLNGATSQTGHWYMHSPFGGNMPDGYEYLSYPVGHSTKDNRWEDGWELLWLNTGYWPDGNTIGNPDPNDLFDAQYSAFNDHIPYIMLYNRYRGTLRIFANLYSDFGTWDLLNVSLGFNGDGFTANDPVNGLLRHLEPYDRPLDQETSVKQVTSFNANAQSNKQWISADFQVGYDPCSCFYPSLLELGFEAIDSMSITLQGRGLSLEKDLVNSIDSLGDFLSVQDINSHESGQVIYHNMSSMVSDYQRKLEEYKLQLEAYNAYQKDLRVIVLDKLESGIINGGAGGLAGLLSAPVTDFLFNDLFPFFKYDTLPVKGCNLCGDRIDTIKIDTTHLSGLDEDKIETMLEDGAKAVLGEGYDFLTLQIAGKKPTKPIPPSRPTVNMQEYVFTGSISESATVKMKEMYTPGSFPHAYNGGTAISPSGYPVYNEVLGMFAMLRTPKINYHVDDSVRVWNPNQPNGVNDRVYGDRLKSYRFSLAEPLSWYLNPALDFDYDKTKVYAKLTVNLKNKPQSAGNVFEFDLDRKLEHSAWMKIRDGGTFCPDNANQFEDCRKEIPLSTPYIEIEDFAHLAMGFDLKSVCETVIPSELLEEGEPIDEAGISNDMDVDILSVELKIMADMQFKQIGTNGDSINTTQVFTYLLYDAENPSLETGKLIKQPTANRAVPYYTGQAFLSDTIRPDHPLIWHQDGNKLYIKANRVHIEDDIAAALGYEVDIQSYNGVHIVPNILIGENITISQNYEMGHPSEMVSPAYISDFCQLPDSYKGNSAANKTYSENSPDSPILPLEREDQIRTAIFPNPAKDNVTVQLISPKDGTAKVEIMDLTGKLLYQSNEMVHKGRNFYSYSVADFAVGIYLIHTEMNGFHQTQKLIVTNRE